MLVTTSIKHTVYVMEALIGYIFYYIPVSKAIQIINEFMLCTFCMYIGVSTHKQS